MSKLSHLLMGAFLLGLTCGCGSGPKDSMPTQVQEAPPPNLIQETRKKQDEQKQADKSKAGVTR